jgi:hypothetical protein
MTPHSPEAKVKWLTFSCPACRVRLCIKTAYAALRGRCPECGYRIDPLRPAAPEPAPARTSDEPLGLVPIEEEWPEPARLVDRDERSSYGLAAETAVQPTPAAPPSPSAGTFAFASGDEPLPRAAPAEEQAYTVHSPEAAPLPKEAALPTAEEVEELLPLPPPPPPPYPLWSGLYTFPWRPENLGVWFFQALNFSLLAVIVTAMNLLYQAGGVVRIGVPLLIPVVTFVFFWTGIYASNCFLANVEDTAAGNDRVSWPEGGGLLDGLGRFAYLMLIAGISLIPVILLVTTATETASSVGGRPGVADGPGHPPGSAPGLSLGWVLPLTPWVLLFPILLLSSLTAGIWWSVLDGRIVGGLFRRPGALFLVCVPSLVVIGLSVGLAQSVLLRPNFALAAGAGFVWSAALLLYGRLLGRAGWILSEARRTQGRGKRRPPKPYKGKAEPVGGAGWGELPAEE